MDRTACYGESRLLGRSLHPGARACAQPMEAHPWMNIAGLLMALAYLMVLPAGLNGMLLAFAGVAFVLAGMNRETLGVFCLLLGPPLVGALFRAFGVAHVGAPASVILGAALLFSVRSRPRIAPARWRAPILWLVFTVVVLTASYLVGPKTEYSRSKLMTFVMGLVIGVPAVGFIVGNRCVDLRRLGMLALAGSALHYSITGQVWPEIIPSSILDPAGLRPLDKELALEVRPGYAGALACFGLMCLLAGIVRGRLKNIHYLQMFLATILGLLVINSIGQRLYVATVFLAAPVLLLCRPRSRLLSTSLAAIIISACVAMAAIGFVKGKIFFLQTFTPEKRTIFERINRDLNWGSAFRRIEERPLIGHGLGGYYLDEPDISSEPGEGRYAHNLILELLSETGFAGAVLIVAPVIIFCFIPLGRRIFSLRTSSGQAMVFLLLYAFCYAMVCDDLRRSHLLFAIAAVLWAYMPAGKNLSSDLPVPETANPLQR